MTPSLYTICPTESLSLWSTAWQTSWVMQLNTVGRSVRNWSSGSWWKNPSTEHRSSVQDLIRASLSCKQPKMSQLQSVHPVFPYLLNSAFQQQIHLIFCHLIHSAFPHPIHPAFPNQYTQLSGPFPHPIHSSNTIKLTQAHFSYKSYFSTLNSF